jgi:NADH dehydrogenase FAD-containing subunit
MELLQPLSVGVNRLIAVTAAASGDRPRVVVVGYGWAGKAFTDTLDRQKYAVTVISPTTRLNQPSMIQTLSAEYSPPPPAGVTWKQTSVTRVADDTNRVETATGWHLPYDILVVATGSETNFFGVPGAAEHAIPFRTPADLERLRAALAAAEPETHIHIVGAGATGVELACRLAEERPRETVWIQEAGPTILPGFSQAMRQRVNLHLKDAGIVVVRKMPVAEVGPRTSSSHPIVVWTAGIRPVLPAGLTGLRVDDCLLVRQVDGGLVYAIGDISGRGPPTAQNARQQGRYLASVLNRRDPNPAPYKYRERGRVLDLTTTLMVEVFGMVFALPPLFRPVVQWVTQD